MTWNPVPVYPSGESLGRPGPGFSQLVLDMEAGQVRLYAQNVRLSEILHWVATETGIIVVLDPSADRLVSFDIGPMPLDGLIRIMLRELNYAGVWKRQPNSENDAGAVLTKLFVYPKGKSAHGEDILIFKGNPMRVPELFLNESEKAETPDRELQEQILSSSDRATGFYINKKKRLVYLKKKRAIDSGEIAGPSNTSSVLDKTMAFSMLMAELKERARQAFKGKPVLE